MIIEVEKRFCKAAEQFLGVVHNRNGTYGVRAEVGDHYAATWQQVEFERADAGTFDLPRQVLAWSEEQRMNVGDGKLTIRIRLRDERTPAGLRNLVFERHPQID